MVRSFLHRVYIENRYHIPVAENGHSADPFRGSDKTAQRFYHNFLFALNGIDRNTAFPFLVLDNNEYLAPVRTPDHLIEPEDLEHFIPDSMVTSPFPIRCIPSFLKFATSTILLMGIARRRLQILYNHHIDNCHGGREGAVQRYCLYRGWSLPLMVPLSDSMDLFTTSRPTPLPEISVILSAVENPGWKSRSTGLLHSRVLQQYPR